MIDLPNNALTEIGNLVRMQVEAEEIVAQFTEDLTKANKSLAEIRERLLPEVLEKYGVSEFVTTDGVKVHIKEEIRASLGRDPDRKTTALGWLTENGYEGIIKRNVVVPFGKGEADQAQELVEALQDDGLDASYDQTVAPQTLSAWARELLENGTEFPLDTFGVTQRRFTKISVKKET